MKKILVSAILTFLTSTTFAQMSPEEREIRQTYARIVLALQIGAVHKTVVTGEPIASADELNRARAQLQEQLKSTTLEVQLSDFRVGKIADAYNEPYGKFVSRPTGQDELQVTQGMFESKKEDQTVYRQTYATAEWVPAPYVGPAEWDTMLLGHVHESVASVQSPKHKYASYTVSVTYQGRTRTTRATWFYGKNDKGDTIAFADQIVGASLAPFRTLTVYPEVLLDDPKFRNHPLVAEWLESVRRDCPGGKRDTCYDETTGKVGVSRQDIDRGPIKRPPTADLFQRYSIDKECKGGNACSIWSKTETVILPLVPNSSGHVTGGHPFQSKPTRQCQYSGSTGTCSSSCYAGPGGVFEEGTGSTYINPFLSHSIRTAQQSGSASGSSSAIKCESIYGGSVVACLALTGCEVNVGVNIPAPGSGGSFSLKIDPQAIYSMSNLDTVNCPSISLSSAPSTPGGCSPSAAIACANKIPTSKYVFVWDDVACMCRNELVTPIIVDLSDSITAVDAGFQLTSATDGVVFRMVPGAEPIRISWPRAGVLNALLALDRDRNGTIDDGTELFGNFTPQSPTGERNGFNALAMYDDPVSGGNGNGEIDPNDAIYDSLLLWLDSNHDGTSQPEELRRLSDEHIESISLRYHLSDRVDGYGNEFHLRSRVKGVKGNSAADKWAYDVYLVIDPTK